MLWMLHLFVQMYIRYTSKYMNNATHVAAMFSHVRMVKYICNFMGLQEVLSNVTSRWHNSEMGNLQIRFPHFPVDFFPIYLFNLLTCKFPSMNHLSFIICQVPERVKTNRSFLIDIRNQPNTIFELLLTSQSSMELSEANNFLYTCLYEISHD